MKEIKSEIELKDKDVDFKLISLIQAVHSVHDVEVACGCKTAEVIKTLIFIGNNPIVIILPGDKRANITKIEKLTGEQGLHMAKPEEVLTLTGYSIGSVSPFGIDSKIKQIADNSIHSLSILFLGSGKNDVLIKMNQTEFSKSFQGTFASISD